ncbi:hypothetical protein Tcan_15130 [Toxocara canis]|uniref:Uncharacterized protein n=2 Tax=Toxocara canis TaxID=6265 RepID=A0A0B2V7Z2_TOXCA|nr:hypothetical protein Tcan_15130 [Toxocara canis]VDM43255.1 unnamed protein product [Toxocara canis]
MVPLHAILLLLILTNTIVSIQIGGDISFDLQLIKHQPCAYDPATSKWNRILEFEGGSDRNGPKLVQRPGKTNCYSIGGKVNVYSEFKGDFSIYIELRNNANKKQVPESCVNQRPDGCGGFGSCLYCNACEAFGSSIGVKAQLLLNGKNLRCGDGLAPGIYDNIELLFCLPPVEDILKTQGLTRESFLSLVQSEDGHSLRSMSIFATVYVFNTDVSKQMQTQARIEAVYRKSKKTFFKDEPLPPDVYWSLPFNMMIQKQRVFVACHKIYGNVQIYA